MVAEHHDQGAARLFHIIGQGFPDPEEFWILHDPFDDGFGIVHGNVIDVLLGQGVDDVAVQDQGHPAVRFPFGDPADEIRQLLGFVENLKVVLAAHVEVGDDMHFIVLGKGHFGVLLVLKG